MAPYLSSAAVLMVTSDLVTELRTRYNAEPGTADYLERINSLAAGT